MGVLFFHFIRKKTTLNPLLVSFLNKSYDPYFGTEEG